MTVNWRALRLLALSLATVLSTGCAPSVMWQGKSPDHRQDVEVRTHGSGQWVELDGERMGPYSGVASYSVVFSPKGGHLAFPALRDSSWFVVLDGREGPRWDGIGQLVFSPDGSQLAYAATRGDDWFVVRDSIISIPADSLLSDSLKFSPEGDRLAYGAWTDGILRVVVDDYPGRPLFGVGTMFFDQAGNLFYVAHDSYGMVFVGNEITLGSHTAIAWPTASQDGDRWAYAASDGGPWFTVVNGQMGPPYPHVHGLVFEPGNGRFAFVAGDDKEEILIVDGRAGRSWKKLVEPIFNSEGGHLGYIALVDTMAVVVIDGNAIGAHEEADDLVFNPRGDRYAYMGTDGDLMAVYHDQGVHPFPLLIGGSLVFSRDGDHWGCLAGDPGRQQLFLAVDGSETDILFDWADFSSSVTAQLNAIVAGTGGMNLVRDWVRAELELLLDRNPK